MASLPESSTFDAGVYQIELTDPVIGGPSGVTNTPLKNLANRTKYLKDHVDAAEAAIALLAPKASPTFTGTPAAPTAPVGTKNTQLATTAFVRGEIDGATYHTVATAARAASTNYTNTTGKAMWVAARFATAGLSFHAFVFVDGRFVAGDYRAAEDAGYGTAMWFFVPPGATYRWEYNPGLSVPSLIEIAEVY